MRVLRAVEDRLALACEDDLDVPAVLDELVADRLDRGVDTAHVPVRAGDDDLGQRAALGAPRAPHEAEITRRESHEPLDLGYASLRRRNARSVGPRRVGDASRRRHDPVSLPELGSSRLAAAA